MLAENICNIFIIIIYPTSALNWHNIKKSILTQY